jgi:hypothetical protein
MRLHKYNSSNEMITLFCLHIFHICKQPEVLDASKEVGLQVKPEETKYVLMSHSQKIGQKHSVKIANRPFEDVAMFKYLGTTLTNQNDMHEEIKSRLNSGNACCHSVQCLLSSCLFSRNLEVKI